MNYPDAGNDDTSPKRGRGTAFPSLALRACVKTNRGEYKREQWPSSRLAFVGSRRRGCCGVAQGSGGASLIGPTAILWLAIERFTQSHSERPRVPILPGFSSRSSSPRLQCPGSSGQTMRPMASSSESSSGTIPSPGIPAVLLCWHRIRGGITCLAFSSISSLDTPSEFPRGVADPYRAMASGPGLPVRPRRVPRRCSQSCPRSLPSDRIICSRRTHSRRSLGVARLSHGW